MTIDRMVAVQRAIETIAIRGIVGVIATGELCNQAHCCDINYWLNGWIACLMMIATMMKTPKIPLMQLSIEIQIVLQCQLKRTSGDRLTKSGDVRWMRSDVHSMMTSGGRLKMNYDVHLIYSLKEENELRDVTAVGKK